MGEKDQVVYDKRVGEEAKLSKLGLAIEIRLECRCLQKCFLI